MRNAKFSTVNVFMYFPALPPNSSLCDMYVRKVIRLAREDIIVPQPPTFTPYNNGFHDDANFDSSIALGTFDIA